ncbi:SCO1/SenC-domain-containing protein [Cokeromyces recurvatus]|uniref:SCO1/SenC-domain-containing protein n=1 Tax=Cokeromyces recurvatus TaxID=90255 RepID=UPI0022209A70|nr:SCO1/SenC-domain-containing protein [Cokeromyces recurvatus]KAI7899689.1 SCO1/SenC-domain-containing protein [Cokeromyces recurvatus]
MSLLTKLTKPILAKQCSTKPQVTLTTKRWLTLTTNTNRAYQTQLKNKRHYSSTQRSPSSSSSSPKIFTWKSAVVLGLTAVGLVIYFKNEKEKLKTLRAKRERDKIRKLGRPAIGQEPFELFNVNQGKRMTSKEILQGHFSLVYFGFTHCPDICPEELDKMAEVVEEVKEVVPIFITVDPLRDTEELVKEYVQDFHPNMIGLIGDAEELKRVARSYRVYSYTPPNVTPEDDYLVDHSIFIYLIDPKGRFVDCYARDTSSEEVVASVKNYIQDYLQDEKQKK